MCGVVFEMVFQLDRYSTKAVLYTHCNSTGTPHMLRVSKIIDYGTLVLTHMARCPQRLFSAADLAATLGLGQPVVSKVLKELSHHDLVKSNRGAKGGYVLSQTGRPSGRERGGQN